MESVRRYVFPVIWMLILGLIAAALVKMAFFGADAQANPDDGIGPEASIDQYATVPVTRGDIASSLELEATVQADPAASLKAATAGEITKIYVTDGDHVQQGDPILESRAESTSGTGTTPAGTDDPATAAPAPAPTYRYSVLRADRDGTVQGLSAMKGQTLSIGDAVAGISPGTYAIIADLTPEQQLQMLDQDIRASAALPTTPDQVACEAPRIQETDPSATTQPKPDPSTEDGTDTGDGTTQSAAARLRCPVPAGTRIVPGLAVTVTVDLGTAAGVLTLPTTAVSGTLGNGEVYVLDPSTGEPVAKPVTLGKRSEDIVEITGGLAEGDEVLQFVPGAPSDPETDGQTW